MNIVNYFFLPLPGSNFRFTIPLFILFGLLIVGSFILRFLLRRKKRGDPILYRLFKKTAGHMRLIGIIGFLLVLARINKAPMLSMRILLYSVLIIFVIWAWKQIYCYRVTYPREHEHFRRKTAQIKYLPK